MKCGRQKSQFLRQNRESLLRPVSSAKKEATGRLNPPRITDPVAAHPANEACASFSREARRTRTRTPSHTPAHSHTPKRASAHTDLSHSVPNRFGTLWPTIPNVSPSRTLFNNGLRRKFTSPCKGGRETPGLQTQLDKADTDTDTIGQELYLGLPPEHKGGERSLCVSSESSSDLLGLSIGRSSTAASPSSVRSEEEANLYPKLSPALPLAPQPVKRCDPCESYPCKAYEGSDPGRSLGDWRGEKQSCRWQELGSEVQAALEAAGPARVNPAHLLSKVLAVFPLLPERAEDPNSILPETLPSIGSLLHASGKCKPCVFAHKTVNCCTKQLSCVFCHFHHKTNKRSRARASREKYHPLPSQPQAPLLDHLNHLDDRLNQPDLFNQPHLLNEPHRLSQPIDHPTHHQYISPSHNQRFKGRPSSKDPGQTLLPEQLSPESRASRHGDPRENVDDNFECMVNDENDEKELLDLLRVWSLAMISASDDPCSHSHSHGITFPGSSDRNITKKVDEGEEEEAKEYTCLKTWPKIELPFPPYTLPLSPFQSPMRTLLFPLAPGDASAAASPTRGAPVPSSCAVGGICAGKPAQIPPASEYLLTAPTSALCSPRDLASLGGAMFTPDAAFKLD